MLHEATPYPARFVAFFVGSTWPSLYTGTTPARYGVHYLIQLQPGSYRLYESAHGPFVHRPPFWRALHAAGLRQAIPLRRVYQAIDSAVGGLVAQAGEATVMVLSAHGMAHWYGAQFLLRDILVRLGAAVPLPAAPARRGVRAGLRRFAGAGLRRLPGPVRSAARSVVHGLRPRTRATAPVATAPSIPVDVERSRCFPHANGLAVGGIRLNLAGREPHGVLQPGADADGFVAQLTAQLMAIVDDRTGEPIIRSVRRTADLYAGERLDHLPDLLVEWSETVPTGSTALAGGSAATVRLRSPDVGELEGKNDYGRTGEHRPGGWLAVAGPGVPAARLAREVSLLDVAPTIAALLGVGLTDVDGRPVRELVPDGVRVSTPAEAQ